MARTLKVTLGKSDGKTSIITIPNALPAVDITEAKLTAFSDSYDAVLGGNQISGVNKAILTESTDTLVYPIN